MEADRRTDEEKVQQAQNQLEFYVKNYKIFIDTCSLYHEASNLFWEHIIPLLHKYQAKVIVPLQCVKEIEKHKLNHNTDEKSIKRKQNAESCYSVLVQLQKGKYIEIRGEEEDNTFADRVFQYVFAKFRVSEKLLLITQDKGLAEDILRFNDSKSVRAYPVHVMQLNRYGYLSNHSSLIDKSGTPIDKHPNSNAPKAPSPGQPSRTAEPTQPTQQRFAIGKNVTTIPSTPINVQCIPAQNDKVYVFHNGAWVEFTLESELGSGGEATVYTTNTPYVAKIYKQGSITKRKYEKIQRMLSKPVDCPGVCYPVAPVYNKNKEYVGFLMPAAKGKELQKSIFLVKQLFLKNFPGWKKRDTVQLCITILEKIRYLHDRNIILGDINPANILVVSPTEVYFVDTDSYQIEDFPCPVGTINFTAPEIQRKHFGDFLRTIGNENFAIATLLFMIMLPGKPPYSQQGGEDPIENIIRMDFSYPFGDNSNRKTPDGPWRFIWSHLTYNMKEAFYTTFRKGEEHSEEATRLSANEWLALFREYLRLLDSGKLGQQDSMSEELYPTRFKKSNKFTYITCKLCGNEVQEDFSQDGYCKDCLHKKGESYKCSRCGKDMLYTNYQKYIKQSPKHEMCRECFNWSSQIKYTIACVDCGRQYPITNGEYEYYTNKGLQPPTRCKSCRDIKKATANQRNTYTSNGYASASAYTTPIRPTKRGSLCYLTTAVCEYLNKPDDCEELTILRNYRDTWLLAQPDGPSLIAEYYRTAPNLVSNLKLSEDYPEYCEKLLSQYIYPCIDLIWNQKYAETKDLYTKMYYYMKSEFADNTL